MILVSVVLLTAGCTAGQAPTAAQPAVPLIPPPTGSPAPASVVSVGCEESMIEFPMESPGEPPGGFRLVRDEAGLARVTVALRSCSGPGPAGDVVMLAAEVLPPSGLGREGARNLILLQLWTTSPELLDAFSSWNVSMAVKRGFAVEGREVGGIRSTRISSEPDMLATIDAASRDQLTFGSTRVFAFNRADFTLQAAIDIDRPEIGAVAGPSTLSFVAGLPSGGGIDFPIHRAGMGWIGVEQFAAEYRLAPIPLPEPGSDDRGTRMTAWR